MPGTAWAEGNDAAGTQTEPQPGAPEVSEEITALQERINALPDADMLESMTPDERDAAYAEVLAVYDAIDALEDPEIIRRAKEELLRRTGGKTYQPPIPAEIQPKIPRDLFQTP